MVRRISVMLFALLLINGCSPVNEPADENVPTNITSEPPSGEAAPPSEEEPEAPSEQEPAATSEQEVDLNDFVLQETGQMIMYHGYAEYGHNETLEEVKQGDSEQIYVFQGVMNDASGRKDENGDLLSFWRSIHVTDETITSRIESEHFEEIRTSLFREKIYLQKPLEINHSWTEQVEIEGAAREAVSTITDMKENEDGHLVITVETRVVNMEGYPDNRYKERIELEEGKGVPVSA